MTPTNNPFDEQVEQEADAYAKKGNPLVDPTKYYAFIAGAKSKAVQDKVEQAVRVALEMAAEQAETHLYFAPDFKDSITSLHSQVLLKLKTPIQ